MISNVFAGLPLLVGLNGNQHEQVKQHKEHPLQIAAHLAARRDGAAAVGCRIGFEKSAVPRVVSASRVCPGVITVAV